MRSDELMRGIAVVVFAPALGQHEFFVRLQHRKPPDFFEVARESALDCEGGKRTCPGQIGLLFRAPKIGRPHTAAHMEPTVADIYRFRVRCRKGGEITWV